MQLPPVGDSALYAESSVTQLLGLKASIWRTSQSRKRKRDVHLGSAALKRTSGKQLWRSVRHVIKTTDIQYVELLASMRTGHLSKQNRDMINKRLITGNEIASEAWQDAIFLVARNDLEYSSILKELRSTQPHISSYIYMSGRMHTLRSKPSTNRSI